MNTNGPRIAAVIVTYRRPLELRRLLMSLAAGTERPILTVIVDNAGDDPDAAMPLAESALPGLWVPIPGNPGPGAGWKRGMEIALEQLGQVDFFLLLDDDVVIPPEALAGLVQAAHRGEQRTAGAVAPLLEDADRRLWAFPEPRRPEQRLEIRKAGTPADCLQRLGPGPHPFVWCTGACVLVSGAAVATCGFPRTDFQMLGEDLEYSMRIASQFEAVFTPGIAVPHLPPPPREGTDALRADRFKFLCLLQNLAYLAFHCPHSAHLRSYLAGNYRRWFRTHGWSLRNLSGALATFRAGAFHGQPAGAAGGIELRKRWG